MLRDSTAHFVSLSVGRSFGGPLFTFLVYLSFICTAPAKCSRDLLKHCPNPPAHDCGSRVSSLVESISAMCEIGFAHCAKSDLRNTQFGLAQHKCGFAQHADLHLRNTQIRTRVCRKYEFAHHENSHLRITQILICLTHIYSLRQHVNLD